MRYFILPASSIVRVRPILCDAGDIAGFAEGMAAVGGDWITNLASLDK
jgi:hypothetical protein